MNNEETMVSVLTSPVQDLVDALMALMTERRVGTAVGAQLDVIARLVGESRDGLEDDELRRVIPMRIQTNRSDGLVEQIIRISSLAVSTEEDLSVPPGTVHVFRDGIAAITVRIERGDFDLEGALILIRFLRQAVSAGVRVTLETWSVAESQMFVFEEFAGEPESIGLGFGSTADASVGGVFASAIE